MIGLPVAAALGQVLASLLYGISRFDPVTFTAGPMVFLAVAALSTWVPASRAAAIPPEVALRAT